MDDSPPEGEADLGRTALQSTLSVGSFLPGEHLYAEKGMACPPAAPLQTLPLHRWLV